MGRPYVNRVVLVGKLLEAPRIGQVSSGAKVANFVIQTARSWRDGNGQKKEVYEDHECVAFNPPRGFMVADVVHEWGKPDDTVYVEGRIEYRTFKTREGVTKTVAQVNCDEFKVVDNW